MAQRSHSCGYCAQQFPSATDKACHVVQSHPQQGIVPMALRLMRPVHCWSCATPIPTEAGNCPRCNQPKPNYGVN